MFSSTGYFKTIECPQSDGKPCQRPFCHFSHTLNNQNSLEGKCIKLTGKHLVSSNGDISTSSDSQPHNKLTHIQAKAATLESADDKERAPEMNHSALLHQVLGEAVKKAITENPILSQNMSSCNLQVDASSILKNVFSNISSDDHSKASNIYLPPPGIPSYNPTPISQLKHKKESYIPIKQYEYTPTSLAEDNTYKDTMLSNLDDEAEFSPIEEDEQSKDDEQSKADFDILEQVMAERSSAPCRVKAIQDKKLKLLKQKAASIAEKSTCKSKATSKSSYCGLKEKSNDIDDKSYRNDFQPPSPVFQSSADIPTYSSGTVISLQGKCHTKEKLTATTSTQIAKEIKVESNNISAAKPTYSENVSKSKAVQHTSHSMLPQISHLSRPAARTCAPIVKVVPKMQLQFSSVEELLQQFDGKNETGPEPVQNVTKSAQPICKKVEEVSPVRVDLENRSDNDAALDRNKLEPLDLSTAVVQETVDSSSPSKRKYDSSDDIDWSRSRKKRKSKHKSRSRHSKKRKRSKDTDSDTPYSSTDVDSSAERHTRKKHRKYSKHRQTNKKSKKHRKRKHKRSRHRSSSSRSDKKDATDRDSVASPLPVDVCNIKIEKDASVPEHNKIIPILASCIKKEGETIKVTVVEPISGKPNSDKKLLPTVATGGSSNSLINAPSCPLPTVQAEGLSLFDIVSLSLKKEKDEIYSKPKSIPLVNSQPGVHESLMKQEPSLEKQMPQKSGNTNKLLLTQSSSDSSLTNSLMIDLGKSSCSQESSATSVKIASSNDTKEQHSKSSTARPSSINHRSSSKTSNSTSMIHHPKSSSSKHSHSLSTKSTHSIRKISNSSSNKNSNSSSTKNFNSPSVGDSLSSLKKKSSHSSSSNHLFSISKGSSISVSTKSSTTSTKRSTSSHKSSHSTSTKSSSSHSSSSKHISSHSTSSKKSSSHSTSSKNSSSHSSSKQHSSHYDKSEGVPKAGSKSSRKQSTNGIEKPTRKGSSDSASSKLNQCQDFCDLLNSANTFSSSSAVKKRPAKVKSNRASKGNNKRRLSVDNHLDRKRSTDCTASPDIGSPLPDLSALDEIAKEDWDQLLLENTSSCPQATNSSDEDIGISDQVDFLSTENPDSTFDCDDDANDPKVIQECYKLFASYTPDRAAQPNVKPKLPVKKPKEVKEPEIVPVRHQRNARTGATGNLLGPKPSLKRVIAKSPAQIMLERYQKLKDEETVLKKKLADQYSHLERTVGVSQLVSSSFVSSSSLSSPSVHSSSTSSNNRFGASSDQYGVSSTAAGNDGKKRIARAPSNVVALMNSKNNLLQSRRPPTKSASLTSIKMEPIETIATTNPKGIQRIAHIPTLNETLERPIISNDGRNKVPQNIRQRYLNTFIDETLKFCETTKMAYDIAFAEENECHDRASNRMLYLNIAVNTLKKLRHKQLSEAAQQVMDHSDSFDMSDSPSKEDSPAPAKKLMPSINPNRKTMTHYSVMASGGQKGSWSIEKPKKNVAVVLDVAITGKNFYKYLKKYILSPEDLEANGYPSKDPNEKGKAIIKKKTFRKKVNPSRYERICARCSTRYTVDDYGIPIIAQTCVYHWGRLYKGRGRSGFETKYSCCQSGDSADGCGLGDVHVSDNFNPDGLRGFVPTINKKNAQPEVFALDCEMCYTTEGNELTRITVINSKSEIVYESLVLPDNPIIDYNTRFSGITEEDMKSVTVSLRDVQAVLLSKFSTRTILMGHSLESDFFALKLLHHRVVDTSTVFPHKLGPPYKRALRNLASELLSKLIQNDVGGHDSAEDAITCIELMQYKVKEDLKLSGLFK